ncbi:MAG: translation initiation factor [Nitrospirae bacterium]|nr:translation initiation factor [Nitrospirota bacterium]
MADKNTRLVYSTNTVIPRKEGPGGQQRGPVLPCAQQKVTVRLDRKGRGGKSVTVVEGIQLPERQQEALLKRLKSGLGTGGTLRDYALEVQGDHREAVMALLEAMGYKPKRSGG